MVENTENETQDKSSDNEVTVTNPILTLESILYTNILIYRLSSKFIKSITYAI